MGSSSRSILISLQNHEMEASSSSMNLPNSPPSESTSSSSSPSPGPDENNEFFLSNDPFSYLLQQDSATDDSSQGQSPPEWSPFTSWLENTAMPQQEKIPDLGLGSDFNFSMPMELDFDSSLAIDPSALHFNTSIFTQSDPVFDQAGAFKPEFFTQLLDQSTSQPGRRLSVTSSSSSSGPSFSPISEPRETLTSSVSGDSGNDDAAAELVRRVLRAAGVTFAVPVDTKPDLSRKSASNFHPSLSYMFSESQPKLPIPRLPRPAHTVNINSQPSTTSSSPNPNAALALPTQSTSVPTVLARPKTSHTTIERRYRTNLNARITSLKQSVPALRVLEARLSGKDSTPTDIVDDRGVVDGVKVGRKMSKANVLGKATEYIRYVLPVKLSFRSDGSSHQSVETTRGSIET